MATTLAPFTEPYKNVHDLVQLLIARGLNITDRQKAERYLSTIGYYRLSAYMIPLMRTPKSAKLFKSGVSFRQAMMLYRFDKKLSIIRTKRQFTVLRSVNCRFVVFKPIRADELLARILHTRLIKYLKNAYYIS